MSSPGSFLSLWRQRSQPHDTASPDLRSSSPSPSPSPSPSCSSHTSHPPPNSSTTAVPIAVPPPHGAIGSKIPRGISMSSNDLSANASLASQSRCSLDDRSSHGIHPRTSLDESSSAHLGSPLSTSSETSLFSGSIRPVQLIEQFQDTGTTIEGGSETMRVILSSEENLLFARKKATRSPGFRSTKFPYESDERLDVSWNILLPENQELALRTLKVLIRKGIPDCMRTNVWTIILGTREWLRTRPDYYRHEMELYLGPNSENTVVATPPLFGGTLHPQCHYVGEKGLEAASRILAIFGLKNPTLVYAVGIPDLILLLLTFMTEEQAFVSLEIMLFQSLRTRWFLNHTFEQHLVFCSTFDSLISMHLPGLYKHMLKLSVSTTESFAKDWFSSLFVGHVKYSIVLRLFDCFLSEGFKVFYRFGLAVLCKCKQYLLKATTTEDFFQILHQAALFSTDSESLFKTAFCFRVKQAQLSKLDKLNSDRIKCHQLLLTSPLKVEPVYYRPIMEKPSSIISQQQCEKIWSMLPHRYGIMDPTLLFSTAVDGFNISTLFTKCGDTFPLLVLVKSPAQHIFGGYLSETIPELAKRGGTQDCESFLFSLHPVEQKYAWTRADHQLACIRDGALVFGGQPGLQIDTEFQVTSYSSDTYGNPPMGESETFPAMAVEVYGVN